MAIAGISVSEAAERLGVRVEEIYRLLASKSKRIRGVKSDGRWYITYLSKGEGK